MLCRCLVGGSLRVTQSCVMNIYREKGCRWSHVQTGRQTGTKTEAQRQRNGGGTQSLVNMEVWEGPLFYRQTQRETERQKETERNRDTETKAGYPRPTWK